MLPGNKRELGHDQANPISQMIWANTLLLILFAIPSLTLVVLLRRKPGFRTVQPWMLALAFLVMFFFSGAVVAALSILSFHFSGIDPGQLAMLIACLAVLLMGIYWRVHAWRVITKGDRWHTKSRGVSYISAVLPFPEHIVQRYIEPGICYVAGLIIYRFLPAFANLGLWLVFSGLCLTLWEGLIYEVQLNTMLDQYDALIDSEVVAENQAYFSGEKTGNPPTIEQTAGISVGFAPELERAIAARRARQAAAGISHPEPKPAPIAETNPGPSVARSAPVPAPIVAEPEIAVAPEPEPVTYHTPAEKEPVTPQPLSAAPAAAPEEFIPDIPAISVELPDTGPRWKCSCDVVNEGNRQVCKVCGKPKPDS